MNRQNDTRNKDRIPVTAVIPCYRCGDVVERALRSVAEQTRLPQRVILVNDACPDTAPALWPVLPKIMGNIPVDILHLDVNIGAAGARNAGWERADTPYIAFLDADDTWHPEKLALQYEWMTAHPGTVFSGHRKLISPSGPSTESSGWQAVSRRSLMVSNRFQTSTVMIRSDSPYRFCPVHRYSEDYRLWLQLTITGHPGVFLNEPVSYGYKHPYADSGLSRRLWLMEKGELGIFKDLFRSGRLTLIEWMIASGVSVLKYGKRLMATYALSRNLRNRLNHRLSMIL